MLEHDQVNKFMGEGFQFGGIDKNYDHFSKNLTELHKTCAGLIISKLIS